MTISENPPPYLNKLNKIIINTWGRSEPEYEAWSQRVKTLVEKLQSFFPETYTHPKTVTRIDSVGANPEAIAPFERQVFAAFASLNGAIKRVGNADLLYVLNPNGLGTDAMPLVALSWIAINSPKTLDESNQPKTNVLEYLSANGLFRLEDTNGQVMRVQVASSKETIFVRTEPDYGGPPHVWQFTELRDHRLLIPEKVWHKAMELIETHRTAERAQNRRFILTVKKVPVTGKHIQQMYEPTPIYGRTMIINGQEFDFS